MKTAAIVISVLLAVTAVLFFRARAKRPRINSFWDAVRNPDAMPDPEQFHKKVDGSAALLSGSPKEIARLVDHYVFDVDSKSAAWTELRILAKLGDQAYPRSLEILRDPSLQERLTLFTETNSAQPESPINRLCEIFDQTTPPPEQGAVLLRPFIQSESEQIRKSAGLIIGSIASPASNTDLRKLLSDKDEYVRSYTLMGIQKAISGGRVEDSSKNDIFELIAAMWPTDTDFNVCEKIPQILLKLDRDRAIPHLLNDEFLTVNFSPAWHILAAFSQESVEVPRSRLLTLITNANKEPKKFPMANVVREALPLLAAHRQDEDLPMFERFLDSDNEDLTRGSTEALYRFHQYSERIRNLWDVGRKNGWDALTVAEKHLCAIEELEAEVSNGGFAQYYFNPSGDHWEYAQAGLAQIGAKEHYKVMSASVKSFGSAMPSADHGTRTSQLSKIVRIKEEPFIEQDNAWYAIENENLNRLTFKYNMVNLDGREKVEQAD